MPPRVAVSRREGDAWGVTRTLYALGRWCAERGSTVVAVGADVDGAAYSLRYAHDDDHEVRLLTEVLVAELLASALWSTPR